MAQTTVKIKYLDGIYLDSEGNKLEHLILREGWTYKIDVENFSGVVARSRTPSYLELICDGSKEYTVAGISAPRYNSKLDRDPRRYVLSKIVDDASQHSFFTDSNPEFAADRVVLVDESTGSVAKRGTDYEILPNDDKVSFDFNTDKTWTICTDAYEYAVHSTSSSFIVSIPQSQTLRSAFLVPFSGNVLPLRFVEVLESAVDVALRAVPEHIQITYPIFVEFITAFYEFMSQRYKAADIIRNLQSYIDLDSTFTEFINEIAVELIPQFTDAVADKKILIKNISQFYAQKGSDRSMVFVMRAFFNEASKIEHPMSFALRTSHTPWFQPWCVTLNKTAGKTDAEVFALEGQIVTLTNGLFEVNIVHKLEDGVFRAWTETFNGIPVYAEDFGGVATVGRIVDEVTVSSSDTEAYEVGDLIESFDGDTILWAKKVNADGSLKQVGFSNPGWNVTSDHVIDEAADIFVGIGTISRPEGWMVNADNITSGYSVLPDQDYYSTFSYEVVSKVERRKIKPVFDRIVSPVGYEMWARVHHEVSRDASLILDIDPLDESVSPTNLWTFELSENEGDVSLTSRLLDSNVCRLTTRYDWKALRYSLGDVVLSGRNVYVSLNDGESSVAPVGIWNHEFELSDGKRWQFLYTIDRHHERFLTDVWMPIPKRFYKSPVDTSWVPAEKVGVFIFADPNYRTLSPFNKVKLKKSNVDQDSFLLSTLITPGERQVESILILYNM